MSTTLSEKASLKRKLGWLEVLCFVGGIALLATYFQVRASGEEQRNEGIQAFQMAAATQSSGSAGLQRENPFGLLEPPDQQLWSDKRKADYAASLEAGGDVPLAVLSIEKLGIEVPVFNGADEHNLNRGVARIKGTGHVGYPGNLGIAGHRDGFFRALKDIQLDDAIELQTLDGPELFKVSSIDIVDPDDVSVLAPTDSSNITLVTCYPFYYVGHAPKRFIVKATAQHALEPNQVRKP